MFRPFFALGAFALVASPAAAATYSAKPAAPVTGKFAARDILWACGGEGCTGSTDNSRPLVLCQGLAKQAGMIASFAVDGRAIAAEDLSRCNKSARRDKDQALANAR